MKRFMQQFGDKISWVLSGLDRIRFTGYLPALLQTGGVITCLRAFSKQLEDFGKFYEQKTEAIKEASLEVARKAGRPIIHLHGKEDKAEIVSEIVKKDDVKSGLICVLTAKESYMGYGLRTGKESKKLYLARDKRWCQHLYHYYLDPDFGLMHTSFCTWVPYGMKICMNGREWLKQQMDAEGLNYTKMENRFLWLQDPKRAQELMDLQLRTNWSATLNRLARNSNPGLWSEFEKYQMVYRWSVESSEWATDVTFSDSETLERLRERLLMQGIKVLNSERVARFLGRTSPLNGRCKEKVVTKYNQLFEGVCVKHFYGKNSQKLYSGAPTQARTESTINSVKGLKAFRKPQGQPEAKLQWLPLRKGVADLHRRCQIGAAANRRYLDAIAGISTDLTLSELLDPLTKRATLGHQKVRGLKPFDEEDCRLLEAIADGAFSIEGFRNRDLRTALFGESASPDERTKQSRKVTHQLRLLRAHGLISKVPKTHRYQLTDLGRRVTSALSAARSANSAKLLKMAA